jgi:hypothetical protein
VGSPIVTLVPLFFGFNEMPPAPRLADALHVLRMAACKETKDLM